MKNRTKLEMTAAEKKQAAEIGVSEEDYFKYCIDQSSGKPITPEDVEKCMDILWKMGYFIKVDDNGNRIDN